MMNGWLERTAMIDFFLLAVVVVISTVLVPSDTNVEAT